MLFIRHNSKYVCYLQIFFDFTFIFGSRLLLSGQTNLVKDVKVLSLYFIEISNNQTPGKTTILLRFIISLPISIRLLLNCNDLSSFNGDPICNLKYGQGNIWKNIITIISHSHLWLGKMKIEKQQSTLPFHRQSLINTQRLDKCDISHDSLINQL